MGCKMIRILYQLSWLSFTRKWAWI